MTHALAVLFVVFSALFVAWLAATAVWWLVSSRRSARRWRADAIQWERRYYRAEDQLFAALGELRRINGGDPS